MIVVIIVGVTKIHESKCMLRAEDLTYAFIYIDRRDRKKKNGQNFL